MARWSTCSARALVASPPLDAAQGGYIAEGYDAALDALRAAGGDGRRAIAALEARYREATGVATLKIRHNAVLGYHIEVPARHADRLMAAGSAASPIARRWPAWSASTRPTCTSRRSGSVEAGAHALAAEAAHLEELTALAVAAAPTHRRHRRRARPARRRRRPRRARGRRRLVPAAPRPTSPASRSRAAAIRWSRRRCAAAGERFVANDCRARAGRPAVAGHRPQHGRQIDLPAPGRADRPARPGRLLRPRRPRHDRHRRPAVQPRRRLRQSRARPLDLHGRNGRDRRDPRPGDPAQPRHPRRDRARHLDL